MWNDIIKTYDTFINDSCIAPIAHTRIIATIGIMLDSQSNVLAAAKIKQSIFAPCTAKSETRVGNGIFPHLIDDNISYVTDINTKRHEAYMMQLEDYVKNTGNERASIVLNYLGKNSIIKDLEYLIDIKNKANKSTVITFGIKGFPEETVDFEWTKYYVSKLPKNGICPITGQEDYIPDSYPAGIRYPGDSSKLFISNPKGFFALNEVKPGYIASQKIIHTLQALSGGWIEQKNIKKTDIVIRQ